MKDTAQLFKALGDETRLRIMGLLLQGELCVCDLVAVLDLPQSTVSRHLSYLKNSGWVADHREGIWMHYSLSGSGSDFQKKVLGFLGHDLGRINQVRQDQKALKKYQSKKQAVTCK